MRKILGIIALLAVVYVTASHFHEKWIGPSTYSGGRQREETGHGACGTVAEVHYAADSNSRPTFLNLGHAYPDQDLIIVIFGDDLANFPTSPSAWEGQRICVTGSITRYNGKPENRPRPGPNHCPTLNHSESRGPDDETWGKTQDLPLVSLWVARCHYSRRHPLDTSKCITAAERS